MSKLLITGGCSFSECISTHIDTWPRHIARLYPQYKHISTGVSSQGNGLISRRIIYEVDYQLKHGINSNDILVCIMWSGYNRFDTYKEWTDNEYVNDFENSRENPTSFVRGATHKGWYIFNPWWTNRWNQIYYKEFSTQVMSKVQTLEHILRTQWFLKQNNVKYVMTTYMADVLSSMNHIETQFLYDMIDHDKFLPIDGLYEWVKENSIYDFPNKNDPHPGTEQHKEFVTKVLHPFLIEKGYEA